MCVCVSLTPCRLHALFDPDVLPTEFGGTHPDCGEAYWEEMKKSDKERVHKREE